MNTTLPLFPELGSYTPPTEGINYIGSKLKVIPYILQLAKKVEATTVLDGFSGTTRVSQALAQSGYSVICNDRAIWSEMFGTCYLLSRKRGSYYQSLIDHLNSVPPRDGWFTQHYGGYSNGGSAIQQDGRKKPWQVHNTQKLDAIREEIELLGLDKVDKSVALTSLVLALDRVDNSLGHYAAYLKDWAPRSYKNLHLRVPVLFNSPGPHHVYREDIFDLLPNVSVDLAYFDPPYGSNNDKMPPSRVRYDAYYHAWKTVCLFDNPALFGRANRRVDSSDRVASSCFEEYRRSADGKFIAVKAVEELIRSANARWIILSYSSGGRATAGELDDILRANGRVRDILALDYKRNVMASMTWTRQWIRETERPNQEFLFLLER